MPGPPPGAGTHPPGAVQSLSTRRGAPSRPRGGAGPPGMEGGQHGLVATAAALPAGCPPGNGTGLRVASARPPAPWDSVQTLPLTAGSRGRGPTGGRCCGPPVAGSHHVTEVNAKVAKPRPRPQRPQPWALGRAVRPRSLFWGENRQREALALRPRHGAGPGPGVPPDHALHRQGRRALEGPSEPWPGRPAGESVVPESPGAVRSRSGPMREPPSAGFSK